MERMACHLKRLSLLPIVCAACLAETPPPVTVPDSVALDANIAYDRFPDTRLDVMYPKAPSPQNRPGAIMFHGGGWIRSSKETMMDAFCLPYLERGFVVANVEYRVAGAALAPSAVNDALRAARWFFDHAGQYHVDRTRIVVTGASAGGHLALMVGMTPASAGTAEANASDEAAIKDVVARYVDARDRKDAKATEALFTADADQLVSSGEWRKGREAVVRGTMASSESSGGKRTITVETVRFVTPGAALADGRYEIAGLNGAPPRRMWSTFLIVRTPESWRIAAIRNMLPAPAAPPK